MFSLQKAGLALCGILAAVGVCLLVFEGPADGDGNSHVAQDPPAPVERPLQPDPEPEKPFVSPEAAESEFPRLNRTVLDVMEGMWLARERNDLAWLARTLESTARKDKLNEDDLHAAHRQFTWRSTDAMWAKARESWINQTYEVVDNGDTAELVLQVGGAMGEMRFQFVRINDGWYFAHI